MLGKFGVMVSAIALNCTQLHSPAGEQTVPAGQFNACMTGHLSSCVAMLHGRRTGGLDWTLVVLQKVLLTIASLFGGQGTGST